MEKKTLKTIANQQTGYFSKIVTDYLDENPVLKPFYQYPVSLEGIEQAIDARRQFSQPREILVEVLKKQYKGIQLSRALEENIELLLQNNSFTITTAHQPNIFTGPLYFVYKILHVIKLAGDLASKFPEYNFIPTFYMGSEDADLDELGEINIHGKEYRWQTNQTGTVGRMKVDKAFLKLMDEMQQQLGIEPHGAEIVSIFKQYYREGVTIQQATLQVVNELFGAYGLVILIPDNADLKRVFNPVIQKELTTRFSNQQVKQTLEQLEKHYKIQAGGRELNLFYLIDDKRERIEVSDGSFKVAALKLNWSQEEILKELEAHPERFSGNVILRGVFQETILPNLAFIGGGGELAYWLELKKVFEAVSVPYPVLILRNSFLLFTEQQLHRIHKLGFEAADFFKPEQLLLNELVKKRSEHQLNLSNEIEQFSALYRQLKNIAGKIDPTLEPHVNALKAKTEQRIVNLEKKMMRAERRKFESQQKQIHQLKTELFPNNSLQERVENLAGFYAVYGKEFIEIILKNSLALEQRFALVVLDGKNNK